MSVQVARPRAIFKVLVVGRDPNLQTGFLSQVSGRNISAQLLSSLGVSLGIARCTNDSSFDIILQLWSIPQNERLAGLTKSFSKGYRGVVVVLNQQELSDIHELLQNLSLELNSNVVIVIVGQSTEAFHVCKEFISQYDKGIELIHVASATEIVNILSQKLVKGNREAPYPSFVLLDASCCPVYEPSLQTLKVEECGNEEISTIRNILLTQGLRVSGEASHVKMNEGEAFISLRNGTVRLEPAICKFCARKCKRQSNVCIIAVDSGWSSQGISQKALLIAAKAIALAERKLPEHVENQIKHANRCKSFELNTNIPIDEIPTSILMANSESLCSGKSLLDAAEDRLRNGKLPEWVFNMLKRRLLSVDESKKK